jgi:hypothetical protein
MSGVSRLALITRHWGYLCSRRIVKALETAGDGDVTRQKTCQARNPPPRRDHTDALGAGAIARVRSGASGQRDAYVQTAGMRNTLSSNGNVEPSDSGKGS